MGSLSPTGEMQPPPGGFSLKEALLAGRREARKGIEPTADLMRAEAMRIAEIESLRRNEIAMAHQMAYDAHKILSRSRSRSRYMYTLILGERFLPLTTLHCVISGVLNQSIGKHLEALSRISHTGEACTHHLQLEPLQYLSSHKGLCHQKERRHLRVPSNGSSICG